MKIFECNSITIFNCLLVSRQNSSAMEECINKNLIRVGWIYYIRLDRDTYVSICTVDTTSPLMDLFYTTPTIFIFPTLDHYSILFIQANRTYLQLKSVQTETS